MKRLVVGVLAALLCSLGFADTKIANLPAAGVLTGSEIYPLQQTGCSVLTGDTCQTSLGLMVNYTETQLTGPFIVGLFTSCSGVKYLGADGACHVAAGAPGGSTNAVQYNASGTLGGVSLLADQALFGTATAPQATAVTNCGDSTHALSYSTSTHTFGCQSIPGLTTPVAVSLGGTGNSTFPVHGVLLGENTSTFGNVAAMAADTFLQGQGASADPAASTAFPSCGDATHALNYNTSTHQVGCQTISAGGSGVTINQLLKATSTSRSNAVTSTIDPDLQFAATASNHTIHCQLFISTPASSGGFRVQLSSTGTVTNSFMTITKTDTNTLPTSPVNTIPRSFNVDSSDSIPNNNDTAIWTLEGWAITSTSGTIGVSWGTQTNVGGNTSVSQGSWCNWT